MPEITFNEAQDALGKFRKKNYADGSSETPKLLTVSGWDKSKVVYKIKDDIERPFKTELDRFNDLSNEAQTLNQERMQLKQKENPSNEDIERMNAITDRIIAINDEVNEIGKVKKEVTITEKITKDKFEGVVDGEIFTALGFAIDMNGQEE